MRFLRFMTARQVLGLVRLLLQSAVALVALPHAWLRRRRRFVRDVLRGGRTLPDGGKVALFVHFDRGGSVHDYVLFYLQELREAGFEIILISNGRTPGPAAMARVLPLCAHVLCRDNVGYDFGAYRDGIAFLGDLSRFSMVVLANDSVYGPIFDLRRALARCDPATPVWGVTDSWSLRYHLQSYFLVLQGEALTSTSVTRFFAGLLPVQSKFWIVRHYEVGFTQAMLRDGLRCAALFPYRDAAAALIDAGLAGMLSDRHLGAPFRAFFAAVLAKAQRGTPLNPMHHFWDHMLGQMRCPFIKRELLSRNPAAIPHAFLWERVIRSVSSYDTELIVRHLQVTARRNRSP
jgi:lipopolysaccharide biosynthesis protein